MLRKRDFANIPLSLFFGCEALSSKSSARAFPLFGAKEWEWPGVGQIARVGADSMRKDKALAWTLTSWPSNPAYRMAICEIPSRKKFQPKSFTAHRQKLVIALDASLHRRKFHRICRNYSVNSSRTMLKISRLHFLNIFRFDEESPVVLIVIRLFPLFLPSKWAFNGVPTRLDYFTNFIP